MVDAGWAATLLARVRTPEIAEEMRQKSHADTLDMMMTAALQMANGALAHREALVQTGGALAQAMARADKYKRESMGQSQSIAKLHQEAKTREESLGGRAREAEAKLCAADTQVEDLVRRLRHAKGEAEAARNETLAAIQRAEAAERVAIDAGHEKAGVVAYANEAHVRAEKAKNRARDAEMRAGEAEVKAEQAEARAQRAEARVEKAVADYKSSVEFEQEVIEGSLDAYAKGFDACKAKVSAAFKISEADLEEIQAGDLGEASAEEEEDQEEPGPSEP